MKYALRILALLCLAPLVFGQASKTFIMQAPTQRENGDALSLFDIDAYTVKCGITTGGPYDFYTLQNPSSGQTVESFGSGDVFTEGTYYCIATDTDTGGLESDGSNEVNFTVGRCEATDCRPLPPILSIAPPET